MSVLDLPLDATSDERMIATNLNNVRGGNGRRMGHRYRRSNRWGATGFERSVAVTYGDDTYDLAVGPKRLPRRPTSEWNDHQAEVLVIRLAAAAQARANVEEHLPRCVWCKTAPIPFQRSAYCSDACAQRAASHRNAEQYRQAKEVAA